jgi:MFS family permease
MRYAMRPATRSRRWRALAVIGTAQLMVVLDVTVMNIALPSAQRALHFTTADRQWVLTAYTLALGSLLLLAGWRTGSAARRRSLWAWSVSRASLVAAMARLVHRGGLCPNCPGLAG